MVVKFRLGWIIYIFYKAEFKKIIFYFYIELTQLKI